MRRDESQTYAAIFNFNVKWLEGRYQTCFEQITFSCEHTHVTTAEAAACAYLQNRNLPLYPYWHAARIVDAGEFAELTTFEEIAENREANLVLLFGWKNRR